MEIAAGSDVVWAVLMDFDAYPDWNPFIKDISGNAFVGEKLSVRIEPLYQDSGMTLTPLVLGADAGQEFCWIGKLPIPHLMDGEHYFLLEETAAGTRITQGETFYGALNYVMDMSVMDQSFNAIAASQ